jgi:hypothetical protein
MVIGFLAVVAMLSLLLLIYYLQKRREEIEELKNIIRDVHGRALACRNAPIYAGANNEIKKTLDYVINCTASTTALNPSPNYLQEILEI